jgi:hypothetical protein
MRIKPLKTLNLILSVSKDAAKDSSLFSSLTKQTSLVWPTDCHPGQAKREPGSRKRPALRSVTIPDTASPFRDEGGCDPLARPAKKALSGERRLKFSKNWLRFVKQAHK